jgi:carboxypeptidase C (cathepsin A)
MAARLGLVTATAVMVLAPLFMETVEGVDPSQLVTNLPGAPSGLNFTQYAGQVTVNETNGRALFYWFFTADAPNATSKPLALWFNGGPGCSSVGNGLLGELGPFYPDGTLNNTFLSLNENSWIKEANIIFLESPVAVGFSYSNTSSDYYDFTDQRTAEDALQFLLNWFEKFPEYKTNELYLTGESYAGHYLPTLAREIVRYNDAQGSTHAFELNFKGWLVGNPWTDAYYNNLGAMDWLHGHNLISDELHTEIIQSCDLAHDFFWPFWEDLYTKCQQAVNKTFYLGFIDNYNVYDPKCNERKSQAGTLLGKRRSFMAS